MGDAGAQRDRIHDLLPWHLNGTLPPDESEAFAAHLSGCDDCRREIQVLGALRAEIAQHGEDFFADHPAPETIVAASLRDPDLPEARAGEVRRHLALCADCALETRWVIEGQADRPRGSRDGAGRRTWTLPAVPSWAAAAAVIVLAGAALFFFLQPRGRRTEVISPVFVDSVQRAPAPAAVEVRAGESRFALLLQVDAAVESLPLAVEARDAAGRLVYREGRVEDLYRGTYLFVLCDRADFPDGDYSLRVFSGADPASTPLEYRFRVAAAR